MKRLRKKNIANIAAGTSIITTKLAARVRFWKIRIGSSGCETRDSMTANAASSATPATSDGDGPRVAPAVRGLAGPGQAEDDAEQAQGAGEGAGDVELAGVRLGLGEQARGEGGGDQADRDVDQEGQAPAVEAMPKTSRLVPVSQPPRIRPTAAPAPDIAAYTAKARLRCRTGGERRGDQRQRGGGGERGAEALQAPGAQQQALVGGRAAEQRGDREDRSARS